MLITAYIYAKQYDKAYSCFLKAIEKFPNKWEFYIRGGEICETLKKYDEAFTYWDKAGELGTYFYDELYAKASCYADIGEYEKSYQIYTEIADKLQKNGYDVEAETAKKQAQMNTTFFANSDSHAKFSSL